MNEIKKVGFKNEKLGFGEKEKGMVELWLLMEETAAIISKYSIGPNGGVAATTLQELNFGVVLD